MARVLLVDATAVVRSSAFIAQPLGLLTMASVLRQAGHQVQVFDCKLEIDSLPRRLREFSPDIVGIRCLTLFRRVLKFVARTVAAVTPKALILVGGPHATLHPEDAIRCSGAAAAGLGEGEATIVELVETVLEGCDLSKVKGVAWIQDGVLHRSPPRSAIADLDTLPMPAWDLLPMELYFTLVHMGTAPHGRTAMVETSRGCPYGCTFCHNIFGRRFRARSAQAVVEQMLYLHRRYGVEEVEVQDDAFNINKTRVLQVCQGLQRSGSPLLISFTNGLRGDILDRETLLEMKLAGTHFIALSPETASPRLQEQLGKRMNLDKLLEAAEITDDLDIFTLGYFMLGFPGEESHEMESTVKWAVDSPLHGASFWTVNLHPGTRLYEEAVRSGRLAPGSGVQGYHVPGATLSNVPPDRFQKIWHSAYRKFYLKPSRALRILQLVKDRHLFIRNAAAIAARFF